MSNRPPSGRVRIALPYALLLLAGLACLVVIALSAAGRQGLGWLLGQSLESGLAANYNEQITETIPAVDATRIAEAIATDEAALTITPLAGTIATVPAGQFTPGPTQVAQVTHTPTPSPSLPPTGTFTPSSTSTPSLTATRTRTSTLRPTLTPSVTSTPPPTATFTAPPPPTRRTPTNTPPSPSITPTPSPTDTPTATTNPAPAAPLSLTVANTSDTLISLVWSNESASDADFVGYNVYSSTVPSDPSPAFVASSGTITSYVVGGLTTGTPYYFVVRGADTIQESGDSPETSGTPSAVATPNPTPPPSCPPPAPADCTNAGGTPDGIYSSVLPTQTLILDLGPNNGILDGASWDFVYYERDAGGPPPPAIQMDWVTVELSIDATNWYVAFAWSAGSEGLAANANIAPFASIPEDTAYCDLLSGADPNDLIPMGLCMSWGGLYGAAPQTGVAIDIAGVVPPPTGEGYRYVRIGTRPDALQPAEIDAIERLH